MPTAEPTRLRGLTLDVDASPQDLRRLAAEAMGVPLEALGVLRPVKVSLDARGRAPRRVYTVDVWRVDDEVPDVRAPRPRRGQSMRRLVPGQAPLIVGTGPAGLWAALGCVEAGQPVVLLDRGPPVDERNHAVVGLRRRGVLDPESNLCFGEGGAGTYSDGKLYTRVKDPRVRRVYEDLVAFGAPDSLLVDAHPHVGTNLLIRLLRRLRAFLVDAGCEFRFHARVTDLLVDSDGRAGGVRLASGEEVFGSAVVLATGHSARGVYEMLQSHE
ncbi:MAG: hypothetical protein QF464_18745, partial [Myxococcota bacterium]|nr:hypothetical protein [Myxococcota bacterium]